ncbi:1-phosphatidylinositol- -bisphosphate phosphodiesterase [Moniliophthora roreri MCA 2997]|uniref:Phosphoinositide phospholipase C n=1 Tax=Moniliophthora roreri (strain MCA 2997) TaxID=1381753 RepID=V2XVI5_MONRO|nr:1-phosphatidylinositol- -bisphosphate phosphodiesterase [Moniliophthora roreri MCA 2997]
MSSQASSQALHSGLSLNVGAADISHSIPDEVQKGMRMTKVTEKKAKEAMFRIDPDEGRILYDSKKSGIIPIEAIKELRFGSDASYYRTQFEFSPEAESRWTTVVFILEGEYKTMHILAPTVDAFGLWKTALEKLFKIRQGLMVGLQNNSLRDAVWEKQYWKGADKNNDQKLDFKDVQSLCIRLSLNFSDEELRTLFKEADVHNRDYLDYTDYQRFVKLIKRRPEVEAIYNKYGEPNGGKFTLTAFTKFLRESQKSKLSDEELKVVFTKHTQSQNAPESDIEMTLEVFSTFLRSEDNCVFPELYQPITHDMTRPISEYYISSSHNTYLIGHQLVGVSTVEGYIRALLHSCRTVELDIYDGDDEPMVYHGKTWTSKVSVREVCQAIAKYAFVASPYPVMISAEVHCGVRQQDMVVEIMKKAFGASLISAPVDGRPKIEVLPSPEDLKGRILLKAKNLYIAAQLEAFQARKNAEAAEARAQQIILEAELSTTTTSSSSDTSIIAELKSIKHKLAAKSHRKKAEKKPKVAMSFSLLSLLVYTVGVKCRGFSQTQHYAPEHIFSLSENSANRYLKRGSMKDIIKHTQTHMVRVYPKGTRVNSTNFEPHRFWAAGAQVVAINWQTFDLGYMINHAMFQRNGHSGYVLKPPALRPNGKELLKKHTEHFFHVTVISAQQLPRPRDALGHEIVDKSIINPFVEVSLHIPVWSQSPFLPSKVQGVDYNPPTDASKTQPTSARTITFKTKIIKNNGFNPVWQEELQLPFDCVGGMTELIFVKFAVRQEGDDDDDEPLAAYCAPLGSLEHGFRYLPLHDSQLSQHLFSTLFVKMETWDANEGSTR